jgi:hypothetical protein
MGEEEEEEGIQLILFFYSKIYSHTWGKILL